MPRLSARAQEEGARGGEGNAGRSATTQQWLLRGDESQRRAGSKGVHALTGRGAPSYRAVALAHRAGPLHPEAACGSLPVSPCDPLG